MHGNRRTADTLGQTGVALFAVQKTLASLEGIGRVDVERGPVENRYRLNTQHYLYTKMKQAAAAVSFALGFDND